MAKAVLISIYPKWCEKIMSGEKTVEIRKSRPKLKTPFRCYVYCTHGTGANTLNIPISKERLLSDCAINGMRSMNCPIGNGKVIGEFVCDRIYHIGNNGRFIIDRDQALTNGIARESCLDFRDMRDYLVARDGYAWHISDLKIYDTPRELDYFRRECGNAALNLHRPPQSWCYVEEDDHD